MPDKFPELKKAIDVLGFEGVGRVCEVSGKAVSKWYKAGRLPRTEATGETNYANAISKAVPEVSETRLLATVLKKSAA